MTREQILTTGLSNSIGLLLEQIAELASIQHLQLSTEEKAQQLTAPSPKQHHRILSSHQQPQQTTKPNPEKTDARTPYQQRQAHPPAKLRHQTNSLSKTHR